MATDRAHPIDGLLLVDKPEDWTSHDVVAKMRGHLGFRRIGHGGTLDPMATGLLVLLLGRGTKLANFIMGGDKTYEGTIEFGVRTNTQDREGEILERCDASCLTGEAIEAVLRDRTGDQMQTPPMVSAVKKDGVPLYKLARQGKTVEREPRLIHVYTFALLEWRPPFADFRLACTKGTYVRTLAADVGDALGCGAHLNRLRRTHSGSFRVEEALPLAELLELPRETIAGRVIPPERVRTIGPWPQ
jgi:tRNA pseudouridine55 synthase